MWPSCSNVTSAMHSPCEPEEGTSSLAVRALPHSVQSTASSSVDLPAPLGPYTPTEPGWQRQLEFFFKNPVIAKIYAVDQQGSLWLRANRRTSTASSM